ncbi:MAG TPA: hypothetical protein VM283_00090 [Armatimonadota bacterium]|nr:hypothetical protein [Armatimonadota bacterium]
MAGLVIAAMTLARPIGFGTAPALGSESVHIQASVQLLAGCLPITVGLLWMIAAPFDIVTSRLRPLAGLIIGLSFASGAAAMALNWAIVMEHVPNHFALVPAVTDAIVATLYAVFLAAMPLGASVAVASQMILRGSSIWLLGYALVRLMVTSGRVFLDADRFMWFFDTPLAEMALLGFVIPSCVGLVMGAMSAIGDPRTFMRHLPMQLQLWHSSVFLWLSLRVWCLRYPGSYQKLVLALVGIGILVVTTTIIADTSILQRIFIPTRWTSRRRGGLHFGGLALGFALVASVLVVATAMMAAGMNDIPPPQLFAALLMAILVGVLTPTIGCVTLALADEDAWVVPARVMLATAIVVIAIGALVASLVWPLSIVVERSLRDPIVGAIALAGAGIALLLLWESLFYRPHIADLDDDYCDC